MLNTRFDDVNAFQRYIVNELYYHISKAACGNEHDLLHDEVAVGWVDDVLSGATADAVSTHSARYFGRERLLQLAEVSVADTIEVVVVCLCVCVRSHFQTTRPDNHPIRHTHTTRSAH